MGRDAGSNACQLSLDEVDRRLALGEAALAGPVYLDLALNLKRPEHTPNVRLAVRRQEDGEPLDVVDENTRLGNVLLQDRRPKWLELRLWLEKDINARCPV